MQVRIHHGPICQPLYFIHLRWGKYSQRPEIYGRLQSGLVYTALLLIPLCLRYYHLVLPVLYALMNKIN